MSVYAVVSGGHTVNTIVWDGLTPLDLPSGETLVPIKQAPPPIAVEPDLTAPDTMIYLSSYGASPTASAQVNTAACQQAATIALLNGGGIICIDKAGTYQIDVSEGIPFDLPNNTTLRGAYNGTGLQVINSGNPAIRILGQYCALENVVVWTEANPTSGALVLYGGSLGSFDNVLINGGFINLEVASGFELKAVGMHLGGSNPTPGASLLKIHRSSSSAADSSTLLFSNLNIQPTHGGYATGIRLQNCDGCWFTGGHGGFASGSQVLVTPEFTNDKITNTHFAGFDIDGGGAGTAGLEFEPLLGFAGTIAYFAYSGGIIEGVNDGPGVLINDPAAEYVAFSGTIVAYNKGAAFQINQGSHISICGGSAAGNGSGVVIGGSAADVVVSGMTAG